MVAVRDKKKAYFEGTGEGAKVMNWKDEVLGIVHLEEDWGIYVVQWLPGTYCGPDYQRSVATVLDDMNTDLLEGIE